MHLVFFMPFFSVIYRHLQIGMSLLSETKDCTNASLFSNKREER